MDQKENDSKSVNTKSAESIRAYNFLVRSDRSTPKQAQNLTDVGQNKVFETVQPAPTLNEIIPSNDMEQAQRKQSHTNSTNSSFPHQKAASAA